MVTVFYYKSMLEKVSMHAKNPAIFSFKALSSGICSFKAFSDFHVPRKYGTGADFGIEKSKLKIGIRISIFIFCENWKLMSNFNFVLLWDWKLKFDVEFQFSFFRKLKIEVHFRFSVFWKNGWHLSTRILEFPPRMVLRHFLIILSHFKTFSCKYIYFVVDDVVFEIKLNKDKTNSMIQ